ncbi:MAG: hydrogenase nickel incorporation protein HypA [Nitrososphaerota archaeon]
MHEWALAESIISYILEKANEMNIKKILEVEVKIGELRQIDIEILSLALKTLSENTLLEGAIFNISIEEAILKCRVCEYEWSYKEAKRKIEEQNIEAIHFIPEIIHSFINCPKCNSMDFEIIKGKDVWIEKIK